MNHFFLICFGLIASVGLLFGYFIQDIFLNTSIYSSSFLYICVVIIFINSAIRLPINTFVAVFLETKYAETRNTYRTEHDKFAKECDDCTGHQLISYNSSQLIRDRFNSWDASEFNLTYTMRSVGEYMKEQQDRKELVLFNYGTNPKIQVSFEGCYNYDKLKKEGLAS